MSDEIEKLKAAVASKTAYANEMLSAWQTKDVENRQLTTEREKLNRRIEELEKSKLRATQLLEDSVRGHDVVLHAMHMMSRAWTEGADLADEIEAILETRDIETVAPAMKERLAEYRMHVAQARQMAHDSYVMKAQEALLLKINTSGLTAELQLELSRFLELRRNFVDPDNWEQAQESRLKADQ